MPCDPKQPVAITGIGLRFPGASTPEEYAGMLARGESAVSELPEGRFEEGFAQRLGLAEGEEKYFTRGGFLRNVYDFDWRAFRLTPAEARATDPQQRLLLELAFEALEDAGLSERRRKGLRGGVCVGISFNDYLHRLAGRPSAYTPLGNVSAFASGRIAHFFGLEGESLSVNSVCSSGLVSLHWACERIRAGELDFALVGGVQLILEPESTLMMLRTGVLSPDLVCRAFDRDARGYVRGEGAAVLVLRPEAPSDRVYASVLGSACNHNGRNEWMAATSHSAMSDVLRRACRSASLSPTDLAYVEMHGAGNPKGDAAEARAMARNPSEKPLRIGSVKPGIGDLGPAGDLAGIVKVALSLFHRRLYPTVNLEHPNPDIPYEGYGLAVQRTLEEIPEGRFFAGVNTTALNGSNAFAVFGGSPGTQALPSPVSSPHILFLSAADRATLERRARDFRRFLTDAPESLLGDICYTANTRRDHGKRRLAALGDDRAGLVAALRAFLEGEDHPGLVVSEGGEAPGAFIARHTFPASALEEMRAGKAPDSRTLRELHPLLGRYFAEGGEEDISFLYPGRRVVSLPPFPWRRETLEEARRPPLEARLPDDPSLSRRISRIACEVLSIPGPLRDTDRFFEIGFDSLSAAEFARRLGSELDTHLPVATLFRNPSVGELAAFLTGRPKRAGARSVRPRSGDAVAVVGMACRFPGAPDMDAYRELLFDGRSTVRDLPPGRENLRKAHARGSFFEEFGGFDARFFGISPGEAARLDPQQALLLEIAYVALEDAGLAGPGLAKERAGVFVGAIASDFATLLAARPDENYFTGSDPSFLSGRLSHFLGLSGPSLTVSTACSSSLVALHLAARSLREGESDVTIVGGVNLVLSPATGIFLSRAGALSPTGLCRAFDDRADGMVRGEGCGVVVLKRLSDALADGDRVRALIRGSGVGHDGPAAGLVAPNPRSQESLIRRVLDESGLGLAYLETHGTGTPLGDASELAAISAALLDGRRADDPLLIGSVKTNIGHTDGASGIAGLLKVVLAFEEGRIPPSLHFEEPSREFDWERNPVRVVTRTAPLSGSVACGVSSFGMSGTNAFAVLEPPPPVPVSERRSRRMHTLVLSARTQEALRARAEGLLGLLEKADLYDICHTAGARREHMERRLAVAGQDAGELSLSLRAFLAGEPDENLFLGEAAFGPPAFLFPGELSLSPDFLRQLAGSEPVFRELLGGDMSESAARTALSRFLVRLGIAPGAVSGWGSGEIAGMRLAGALSDGDARKVADIRERFRGGEAALLSASLTFEDASDFVADYGGELRVVSVDSPSSVTVAGGSGALEDFARELSDFGILKRLLPFPAGFPDAQRLPEFRDSLEGLTIRSPSVPYHSPLAEIPGAAGSAYWVRNLFEPAHVSRAADSLLDAGFRLFVTIGPEQRRMLSENAARRNVEISEAFLSGDEKEPDLALARLICACFVAGASPDFKALYPGGRPAALPAYPWRRDRFEPPPVAPEERSVSALISRMFRAADGSDKVFFEIPFGLSRFPWLSSHRVGGSPVAPASFLIEILCEVSRVLGRPASMRDIEYRKGLFPADGNLQLVLTRASETTSPFELFDASGALHACGVLSDSPSEEAVSEKPADIQKRLRPLPDGEFYDRSGEAGVDYGPEFRCLRGVRAGEGEYLAEIRLTPGLGDDFEHHPAHLDGCMHILAAKAVLGERPESFMPVRIAKCRMLRPFDAEMRSHAVVKSGDGAVTGDIRITDDDGRAYAEFEGVELRLLGRNTGPFHKVAWREAPSPRTEGRLGDGVWIVFSDREKAIARSLRRRGMNVRVVTPGEGCPSEGSETAVDPRNPAHYRRVFEGDDRIAGILFLWALDAAPYEDMTPHDLEASVLTGLESVLRLAQALFALRLPGSPPVLLATRGVHSPEAPSVAQAPLWGFGRSFAREFPDYGTLLVDLDPASSSDECAKNIVEALLNPGEGESLFSGGNRHVSRLVRESPDFRPPVFRPDASYLVTGGLGGMGVRLCRHLVENGARHLVLTGRSPMPAREKWPELTDRRKIDSLLGLERLGASVRHISLDASSGQALADFLEREKREERPAIRGVFHLAGEAFPSPISDRSADSLRGEVAAKIFGAFHLDRLFEPGQLDHFVLFSSQASVLGAPLLAPYAAANAFLDALARRRRARNENALAVNWGYWKETGMGAQIHEERGFDLARAGIGFLSPEEGLAAMGKAFGFPEGQIGIMSFDAARFLELRPRDPFLSELSDMRHDTPDPRFFDRSFILKAPPEKRPEMLESYLIAKVAGVLGIDPDRLSVHDPYDRMGINSLMAQELENKLEKETGVTISLVHFLQNMNTSRLAKLLLEKFESS